MDTSIETEADTEGFASYLFYLDYDAASQSNHVTQWMESKRNIGKSTGAHMMALCPHTITDIKTSFAITNSAYCADFNHDANLTE
eukprot:2143802-Ditylum_brightwellii.AAC.1